MDVRKRAVDSSRYRRRFVWHESARSAFRAYLERFAAASGRPVLLPAYIGWSPREGSGVFDPIRSLALPYCFYRMSDRLELDLPHLEALLADVRPSGRADPLLRESGPCGGRRRPGGGCARYPGSRGRGARALLGPGFRNERAHGERLDPFSPQTAAGRLWRRLDPEFFRPAIRRLARRSSTVGPVDTRPPGDRGQTGPQREPSSSTSPIQPRAVRTALDRLAGRDIPQSYPVLIHSVDRDRLYNEMNAPGSAWSASTTR